MTKQQISTEDLTARFRTTLYDSRIYKPEEIEQMIRDVRPNFRFAWSNKKLKYFNVPAALDIETTSFYQGKKKCACMYEWTLGLYGSVMIGRTYDDLVEVLDRLAAVLDLGTHKRLLIFVHNLAYEFQFICGHFTWEKVFAIDTRKPLYALTDTGLEFRCSYLLSGYSLDKLGEQLHDFQIRKLTGALDYSLLRHYNTPLTDKEIAYCVNDVKVVMAYIMERIQTDGGISKLPLTKTGYVRKYCRDACFYGPEKDKKKRLRYKELMKSMTIEPEEYRQMKRAFQGGFTHANPFYSGRVLENVTSYDFTSSYPAVMVAEEYPMSTGEVIRIESREHFDEQIRRYCCIFDVEFTDLVASVTFDNYISQSKCWGLEGYVINNGRVVSADLLRTTITEQDFLIIRKMYKWDKMRVSNFRRYRKTYLPTDFVRSILELYKDKTTLKGVEGKEVEYLRAKEMINSCYGMTVTDIVRPIFDFTDHWEDPVTPDLTEEIEKYNRNPGRFLFYLWGVYVTAYARRNLFSGILECGSDYVYSDTDSIKILNAEDHQEFIAEYNQRITAQIEKALDFHKLPREMAAPETVKGIKKPLGVWDFDGFYTRFKTLGAKRYMTETDSGINVTVAGINKKHAMPFLYGKYGKRLIFHGFSDRLYVPAAYTGKSTHTYIDQQREGVMIDYLGQPGEYHEKSSIHLEQSDYTLSISREYSDYLTEVRIE